MRYDAVIFDLDGTMTESAPGIYSAVRHAAAQMGREAPDDRTLRKFVGPSIFESMQAHGGFAADEVNKAVAIFRAYYVEHGLFDAAVYSGIPNLLRQLKAAGVYLAVATAKPTATARRVLEHFGLYRFFDRVVGARDDNASSSKAETLRAALPARYTRAAMVGDRFYDMEAAKALRIDAIGAGWGYGTPEELLGAGADAVVATVEEAAEVLLGKEAIPQRGFFISVEGLDGSGKTTQINAVAAYIRARGYAVITTREPGGTPISEEIRPLVLSPDKEVCAQTEALLYAAARAQLVCEVIRPTLEKGGVVLCDRYVDASIAYQGGGRELGVDRVAAINAFATGDTMPDMTLLLVVDVRTGLLRRRSATKLDRIEQAGEAFFGRVYDAYALLARNHPERIRCIDGQRGIDAVTADACRQVDRLLSAR